VVVVAVVVGVTSAAWEGGNLDLLGVDQFSFLGSLISLHAIHERNEYNGAVAPTRQTKSMQARSARNLRCITFSLLHPRR
jgi:hypothetical protein